MFHLFVANLGKESLIQRHYLKGCLISEFSGNHFNIPWGIIDVGPFPIVRALRSAQDQGSIVQSAMALDRGRQTQVRVAGRGDPLRRTLMRRVKHSVVCIWPMSAQPAFARDF